MSEFILGKILGFAKNLRIFEFLSILIIILTAPLSGILTFHLHASLGEFFIHLPRVEIPFFGYVLGREYDLVPALSEGGVGLIIWFFLFWFFRRELDSLVDCYLVWLSRRQKKCKVDFTKIDSVGFSESWIMQGSPILKRDGLAFTNSNSGCLLKRGSHWIFSKNLRKWKDFKADITLDFIQAYHIVNEQVIKKETETEKVVVWKQKREEFRQVLGIVFRAQNLEDYFMIEVWKVDDILSFRPHIRMSGNWDAPVYNSPTTIRLNKNQITVNLKAKDNVVYISVGNLKILEWALPNEFEANLVQHPKQPSDLENSVVVKIPFRNKVGMFGFRNYGNELALVKKLEIQAIK